MKSPLTRRFAPPSPRKRDEGPLQPPGPSPRSRGEGAAKRRMRGAILTMLLLAIPTLASACPVCFGDPNSAMVKGTNNGIFFLLGVIGFVQVGLGAMFVAFWRRARALRARRDSLRVINGGLFR